MDALREARGALRRNRPAEALVHLWNAVEPARLAGDRRRLEAVGTLASVIALQGEDAERAEAQRLVEAVSEALGEPGGFAGAEDVGTASVGGEPAHELPDFGVEDAGPGPERVEEPDEAEAEARRGGVPSLWTILIILFVIFTIVRNIVEGS